MKVYSPADVSRLLNIKPATLRKYSSMLEEQGYYINRNSQNHRYYRDKDIITLRNVIAGKDSDVSLKEAIHNVVNLKPHSTLTNDTNNSNERNSSDTDIKELKELIKSQNELIKGLANRLDQQEAYIDNRLQERDRILMETLNEMRGSKQQKQLEESKKGFWDRLFKR